MVNHDIECCERRNVSERAPGFNTAYCAIDADVISAARLAAGGAPRRDVARECRLIKDGTWAI
jgi:hypothetical protein